MATAEWGPRTASTLAVCLLAIVPLAGCLSGGAGTGEDPQTSAPLRTETDRTDPSLRVSVQEVNATAVVLDLGARPPNGTVQVSWSPTAPPSIRGSRTVAADLSQVPVRDLAPNRTYRFQARSLGDDGAVLAEAVVEGRTDPFPWAAPDEATLQPGIGLVDPGCTLGFVLSSLRNASIYAVTAGHCWENGSRGDPVMDGEGDGLRRIGRVAVFEDRGDTLQIQDDGHSQEFDWGLVRIRPSLRHRTSPSILNVTGPTGVADAAGMERGDRVCWQGDTGLFQTAATDQYSQRCGAFASYERGNETRFTCPLPSGEEICLDWGHGDGMNWFSWYGITWAGDSGSPVVDAATGEALGIITEQNTHLSPQPLYDGTDEGPTLASILDRAAERGWHLRLARADYREPGGWTG